MSVWRERISSLTDGARFFPPASDDDIDQAATDLGGPLPESLVELLRETDGVDGDHGLGLVWPLARIVADNVLFRTSGDFVDLHMPFEPLLFFGDAGNGDQFAFVSIPRRDEVFVWDHESDSRTWAAGSLDQYLQWWLEGRLTV